MSSTKPLKDITALAFESRMSDTTAKLLQRYGAQTISAPSMQEVPLEDHSAVFAFAEKLFAGEVDILICNTGVGTGMMIKILKTRYDEQKILNALSEIIIVSRGPKPAKVLRSLDISINIKVPEPNTWKEILVALSKNNDTADLHSKKVAIQEYGEANKQLNRELKNQGAELIPTSIYRWALPDNLEPLKNGIQSILDNEVQIALFTSKTQVSHVMKVADQIASKEKFHDALKNIFVASIGPVCTKGLKSHGIQVDLEPSRPKLGIFINEIAEQYPGQPVH